MGCRILSGTPLLCYCTVFHTVRLTCRCGLRRPRLLTALVCTLPLFFHGGLGPLLLGGGFLLRGFPLRLRLILLGFSFVPQIIISEDRADRFLGFPLGVFDNAFDSFAGTALVRHHIYLRIVGYQVDIGRIPGAGGLNRYAPNFLLLSRTQLSGKLFRDTAYSRVNWLPSCVFDECVFHTGPVGYAGFMTSLWINDARVPARLRLTPGLHFDTVVIGGGITGLVTALLLAESGARVAVVEGRRIGAGATGASTGKISLLQGTRAQRIVRRHSLTVLADYLEANKQAQQWLLRYCAEAGVPVQTVPALTYAQHDGERDAVHREYEVTRKAGLPTFRVDNPDTPFPACSAVCLNDQAQLDPMTLLAALAVEIEAHAAPIFESTLVRGVRSGPDDNFVIDTEHGELGAGTIVLATGTPILDRGGFFARLSARRSYLTAFRTTEPVPQEMYLSAGRPTRSVRHVPRPDGDLLLVGGNGHLVGRSASTRRHAEDLIDWTRRWFPSAEPIESWSAQDYTPIDELPYAGPLLPGRDRILVATGYAKWGLTNGVAAALTLAGRITGKPPAWSGVLATWRPGIWRDLPGVARTNVAVAQQMATGWLGMVGRGRRDLPDEGCGRVERHGLHPTAVSTVDGTTTELSAVCPHLYGMVCWNDNEKSWDCPLHGSRFAADGTVLEGPATKNLTHLATTQRPPL